MYAKVFFSEIGDLVRLSRLVGCAPCQVLGLNNVTRESDLVGRDILIAVNIGALGRSVGQYYVEEEGQVALRRPSSFL